MSGDPSALLYQYIREQDEKGFKQLIKTLGKKQIMEVVKGLNHVQKTSFSREEVNFYKRMVDEINTEGGIGASRHKSRKSKNKKRKITRRR